MPNAKSYSLAQIIRGYFELMRPMEWSKSLFNMSVGLLIAFYVYSTSASIFLFFEGFLAIVFLWSGLYALNDFTDWRLDKAHDSKRLRAIPSGRVGPRSAFVFSIVLLLAAFAIAWALWNALFFLCMCVMLFNQWLYTARPFRLKERKGFDIISGSFINPVFRYLSGLVLFVPFAGLFSNAFPLLPLVGVVFFQVGGYSLYRVSSKKHDIKMKMHSTVAGVPEEWIKSVSYVLVILAFFSLFSLFILGALYRNAWLGFVPLYYIFSLVPLLASLPMVFEVLKSPSIATAPGKYKRIYRMIHYTIICITLLFIFIFLLFP